MHGLSCHFSECRHYRHSAINDTIHRALALVKIPSRLEPTNLSSSEIRLDGMHSSLGKIEANVWFGTPPAQTHLFPRINLIPPYKLMQCMHG